MGHPEIFTFITLLMYICVHAFDSTKAHKGLASKDEFDSISPKLFTAALKSIFKKKKIAEVVEVGCKYKWAVSQLSKVCGQHGADGPKHAAARRDVDKIERTIQKGRIKDEPIENEMPTC